MTMEREEAIKTLQHCGAENFCPHYISTTNCYGCNMRDALDMAIDALKADDEDEPQFYTEDDYWNGMFTESAEAYKAWTGEEMGRPHGEWIERLVYNADLDVDVPYIECDQCGHRPYFGGSYRPKYCEECGAKMDGNTDKPHGFTADEWYRENFGENNGK